MAKYVATSSVTVYDRIELAVAGLETKLETADNDTTIQACGITKLANEEYAAYVVYTAAVA